MTGHTDHAERKGRQMPEKDLRIPADPKDLIRAVLKGGGVPKDKKPRT